MKPPQFEFVRPSSVEDAVAALNEHGESARILAGGQSLIPMMNFRLAQPSHLIDITRIPGLDSIEAQGDWLVIGAAARQSDVEEDELAQTMCPLLVEALKLVAHEPIRHRGTVCGSLAHADPHSELAATAVALGAELTVLGADGARQVPASEFFQGPFTTAVEAGEMLTHVRFPRMNPSAGFEIQEFSRTHGNFAVVGAIAVVEAGSDGTVASAAISLFGLASRPVRCSDAEARLTGGAPTPELIREVADLALDGVDCSADMHGSAEYRASVGRVYVRRVLTSAIARAQGVQQ